MAKEPEQSLVAFVTNALAECADAERAPAMQAYMKTTMPFLGVAAKDLRSVARMAARKYPVASPREYEAATVALWKQPNREEKHVAIAFAREFPAFVDRAALSLFERLVREGAWWDFVDEIAIHLVGSALAKAPDEVFRVMDRWIDDSDMWIRRTAILCQNRMREKTDEERLFRYCRERASEKEFFIRKAIGWALREYAYTAPDAVREFVDAHRDELSNLSIREATKHL